MKLLGWSRTEWRTFVVVLVPILIAFPLVGRLFGFNVSDLVLWATGLVLLAYTVETQAMRIEMTRQNEIHIQPVLVATIEERRRNAGPAPTYPSELILRNIGRGTALFIRVGNLALTDVAGDRVRFVAKFKPIDYLEPGKDFIAAATCEPLTPGVLAANLDPLPSLNPASAIENHEVSIQYQDTSGQLRQTVMRMGQDGIRLVKQGRV